ncbi:hypothetical protein ACFCWG_11450 [Streptomyces sp. NPDC056390]|uniref:hypothetical protein n=1 Tax=Streptomyces sp. NPDC056390 TaxID=3345806 RepID=UPI0035DB9268
MTSNATTGWPVGNGPGCTAVFAASSGLKDDVIYLRSAGVDLGKRFLLACV